MLNVYISQQFLVYKHRELACSILFTRRFPTLSERLRTMIAVGHQSYLQTVMQEDEYSDCMKTSPQSSYHY